MKADRSATGDEAPATMRRHASPGVRIAVACLALAAAVVAGIALARTGAVPGRFGDPAIDVGRLVAENRLLRDERDRLVASSDTLDSRQAMERATLRELGDQVARLEADNARLKEDVAFFEAATADRSSGATREAGGGIAIRRFQVTEDKAAHVARYRLLITQDPKAVRDFEGDLQLALSFQQAGRVVSAVVPGDAGGVVARAGGDATDFAFSFRSYKRLDGSLDLPPGLVLRSVQARIRERGAVRAQQTVTLD